MATGVVEVERRAQPFVKWAGGKRQLLGEIRRRLPESFDNYYEPFVGGGAVFFDLRPARAAINDVNASLINAYCQIRDAPLDVMDYLDAVDAGQAAAPCAKTYYYEVRERYNEALAAGAADPECAALFIYVNKHCFNGLYRVNAKGRFNVPFNNSRRASYLPENILSLSEVLKSAVITCGDFEPAVDGAKTGDFVFFDSPYVPLKADTFEAYTKEGFAKEEHERLARLFRKLAGRGVSCMLTNHDTPFIRKLYDGFPIDSVAVRRSINSDASKRTGTEVIITSYRR